MNYITIITINIIFISMGFAQSNLVLNPSFELFTLCPNNSGIINNGKLTHCSNPNILSPDYYNICDSVSFSNANHVPDNICGYQTPKEGNAYVGLATWTLSYNGGEYIQMKLANLLSNSHHYAFKCYLSNAECGNYGASDIGVYFSNDSVYNPSMLLPYSPQIQNQSGNFFADTNNWVPFSGIYTANGGERFLIIGNFNDGINNPDTIRISHHVGGASREGVYFYVDDVSLTEVTGIEEQEELNFELFPNPANQNLQVNSSKPISRIVIYNLAGESVLDFNQLTSLNKYILDVSKLAAGLYHCGVYYHQSGYGMKKFSVIN
jgi:OOP family OmpA-OmpF porin